MPAFIHRVTKYDPAHRDEQGHHTGPEDTLSDHGEVEAAYLRAVAAFAEDSGVDRLTVREPQVPSLAHFGAEPPVDGFGLAGLFPSVRQGSRASSGEVSPDQVPEGFHDGAVVSLDVALELVRAMLRDNGAWCRLEVEDRFTVHVGWDQYLYIGSDRPCERASARTRSPGSPAGCPVPSPHRSCPWPPMSAFRCSPPSCPIATGSYGPGGGPSRRLPTGTGPC
ncbi:hypothetical protein [Streptomyces cyaneofuscatus]|uniref:hypothetical protein n=1 Tax=Streptomyces cyaneofuscatus TaxID=66883 RepID=UPI003626BA5B